MNVFQKPVYLHWDLLCIRRATQKALCGAHPSLLPGPHRTWETNRGTVVKVTLCSTLGWWLSMSLEGGIVPRRVGMLARECLVPGDRGQLR